MLGNLLNIMSNKSQRVRKLWSAQGLPVEVSSREIILTGSRGEQQFLHCQILSRYLEGYESYKVHKLTSMDLRQTKEFLQDIHSGVIHCP